MMVYSKSSKRKTVIKCILFILFFFLIVGGFGIVFSVLTGREMASFEEGLKARDQAIASGSAVSGQAVPGK